MRHRQLHSTRYFSRLISAGLLAVLSLVCVCNVDADHEVAEPQVVSECIEECRAADESQVVAVKTCFGTEGIRVAPQDEIWVVSTRQTTETHCGITGYHAQRFVCGTWHDVELSQLASCHQSDREHNTVILVHGNNTSEDWALTRGMQFYDRMFGQDCSDRPAVRLVILSWDSEKVVCRPVEDFKIKAARAVAMGTGVDCFLQQLGGDRPVLVGYSLGVQVVLSTLTNMANHLDSSDSGCGQGYLVALIAPALDADYACESLSSISCNPVIDHTEIFVNRHDRAVRAAQIINRKRCDDRSKEPSLIGLADKGRLDSHRFHMTDVTREVQNRHSLGNYIQSSTLQCHIRELVADSAARRGVTTMAVNDAVEVAVAVDQPEVGESESVVR